MPPELKVAGGDSGLRIQHLRKSYRKKAVIRDFSMALDRGEVVALLGPNGSGKTTTFYAVAGLVTPEGGRVTVDGKDVTTLPMYRRAQLGIGYLPQEMSIFRGLSVQDNISAILDIRVKHRHQRRERLEELLTEFSIEHLRRAPALALSGGERRRVEIARCLAANPNYLLLDEPLGALDKKLRQDTQFELMDIQESTGTTFVIVTHDQEEAMTVASRVAVMDEGRVIQVATPAEIYEAPNSVYVADFIGDVNIIEASTKAIGQDQYHLNWIEGQPPLTATSAAPFSEGQQAHLAIRPEKIRISTERPEDAPNALQGKVLDIAYLGNLSTYHVELPGGQVIKAQTANTRRIARRDITWEDPVWISWSATAGVLLAQ